MSPGTPAQRLAEQRAATISAKLLAGLTVVLWVIVKGGLRALEAVLVLLDRVEPAENVFAGEQLLVTRLLYASFGLAAGIFVTSRLRERFLRSRAGASSPRRAG